MDKKLKQLVLSVAYLITGNTGSAMPLENAAKGILTSLKTENIIYDYMIHRCIPEIRQGLAIPYTCEGVEFLLKLHQKAPTILVTIKNKSSGAVFNGKITYKVIS